jgi:hypothetical protein
MFSLTHIIRLRLPQAADGFRFFLFPFVAVYFIQWDSGVGLAFALFTALLMLCILGTLAIIIRFRRNSLIRASSPFFLGIVLIGILIGLASIFTEYVV